MLGLQIRAVSMTPQLLQDSLALWCDLQHFCLSHGLPNVRLAESSLPLDVPLSWASLTKFPSLRYVRLTSSQPPSSILGQNTCSLLASPWNDADIANSCYGPRLKPKTCEKGGTLKVDWKRLGLPRRPQIGAVEKGMGTGAEGLASGVGLWTRRGVQWHDVDMMWT